MNRYIEPELSLTRLFPFTEAQIDLFKQKLNTKVLPKKAELKSAGGVSEGMAFVHEGALRLYQLTEKGDITLHFYTAGTWVADLESLLQQQPTPNVLKAIEPATVSLISLRDIHDLIKIDPTFAMLNGLLAGLTSSTSFLASIQTDSPDERYAKLLEHQPDWVRRFPQKYIASYLGITPETLSRVRARMR